MITIPMSVQAESIVVPMSIGSDGQTIGMTLGASYSVQSAETYGGSYEVTPRLYTQSLDTDGKLMENDVTVYEIPISHTTNPTGGLTVLIG